uniref:uncharacterized protein n=1 Tax=Myxine glutinosa TaxID=7769 RepID=UPI00358E2535
MPHKCVVFGCPVEGATIRIPAAIKNQGEETQRSSEARRREWIRQIGCKEVTLDTARSRHRLCHRHFQSGYPARLWDKNNPDWIPSLHMGHANGKSPESARHEMAAAGLAKIGVTDKISTKAPTTSPSQPPAPAVSTTTLETTFSSLRSPDNAFLVPETNSSSSPVNLSLTRCNTTVDVCDGRLASENLDLETQLKELEDQVIRLTGENVDLKTKLRRHGDEVSGMTCGNIGLETKLESSNILENTFVGCDSKVQAYTGLSNFCLLMILFNLVGPHLRQEPRSSLSKFQQLMLCLMKLRFNLPVLVLADMFRVSTTIVSRTFRSVIDVMYLRMQPLVVWPERDCLHYTMPLQFKKYFGNKIAVIIDCFEVFVEKPSSLQSHAQTFSMNKHQNAVKYLVGIAPQGAVTFVSKGWGGQVSDKHLIENCALLDKLIHGDVILADMGFNIKNGAVLHCADAIIPAFAKEKFPLSPLEVETTGKTVHARTHVERVIGHLRQKYTILSSTVPIDCLLTNEEETVTTLDKMVFVGCALINMCPSVITFD